MSRRSVPRISPTDLREHADQERVDRVWQRLEASFPSAAEPRQTRRVGWVVMAAAAAAMLAFGGGVTVGRGFSKTASAKISDTKTDRTETEVLAAGDDARSFPLPGGGQLTLKPGSIVEVQRAGGGVSLKLVQGDATLETAAGAANQVRVGDALLEAQASSTVTMSKRADNVDVGVSRGAAVVDSPSLKKNLESGENVSVPLHRQVTASNDPPTAETPAARRRARHADAVAPEASVAAATPAVGDWQKAYASNDLKTAATLLRQNGTFDSAVKSANTAKELYEIRDLALQEKEFSAANRAVRRIADDFPSAAEALAAAHELCAKLPPAEGQKYCEQEKNSPLRNPEAAACRVLRQANKDEAPKLAQEYLKSHADGGTCRDEAERILHPGADDAEAAPKPGDGGAPKGDAKAPPKP